MSEKAGLLEQLGVAVNTSALELRGGESDLLRVAALGAASLEISTGADLQNLPIAAVAVDVHRASSSMRELMLSPGTPDRRDAIVGELSPLLVHIREGGQHGQLPKAIVLYVQWLRHRRSFAEMEERQLHRFSTRVLHEWLSDTCRPCGGTGKLERTRSGAWIRPRGSMQRNAVFGVCRGCGGTGRARPSQGERARWMELTMAAYERERWMQRFSAGLSWLSHLIARRVHRPLTAQLERRRKRI